MRERKYEREYEIENERERERMREGDTARQRRHKN